MAAKDSKAPYVGEKFGQKRPPLSITIKQILERYPDGQIFKEMIQNADDAGAKKVQFFVDCRSFGTESLANPGLAPFQGPALLSVNDATFSEKDWKGIESLQQSIKADDPFKVGRFGIGFNSVYHLTDVPVIISGEKVAYLEPQEKIWTDQSGRSFSVSELQNTDSLKPFHDISEFNSNDMTNYGKTIFRFPLRTKPSGLSENLYDVRKVHELINALREEAKLLLVFLRSVDTIEVYDIARNGTQTLCFKAEISEKYKSSIGRKRKRLLDKLKHAYEQKSYNISEIITFSAKFAIKVSGENLNDSQRGEFHWLVSNQVGSEKKEILEAAAKQKVFPWVGTAIDLNEKCRNGRIFCFLPMPIEAASNLPVHVNGTFGLTDDRRSLKWPGVERKNDPTADWNKMIVKFVLPKCYVALLLEAKKYLSFDQFYKVWPSESSLRKSTWGELLEPMYKSLLAYPVIWSKVPKKEGEWIEAKRGCFVQETSLDSVIQQSLVSCGVSVVNIPQNVWAALKLAGINVKTITPKLVRMKLKDQHKYTDLDREGKCIILDYCMSDNQYFDLIDLQLLPLSNKTFEKFQKDSKGVAKIYVSSSACPSYLLPNLQHMIVDLSAENPALHDKLLKLAKSDKTQVKPLADTVVASYLEQAMPREWKGSEQATMPHPEFPKEWFENFWKWAEGIKQLKIFSGKCILPVSAPANLHQDLVEFCVIKMTSSQAVLYIPSGLECSRKLQQSLDKLGVFICRQDDFPFVSHKHLKTYVKPFDTNGLLDAIAATANYGKIKLTGDEAETLRDFIKPGTLSANQKRVAIAEKLNIFVTTENSSGSLLSVHQMKCTSTLKKAIAAPLKSCLDISKLPTSMLMFSQDSGITSQVQLLQKLNVIFPSDCEFILSYLLPMIRNKSIPDALIDDVMIRILDAFHALAYKNEETIREEIRSLSFIRTTCSGNRKCPTELFDPRTSDVQQIFEKDSRVPVSPYDDDKYLDVLKECGLRQVIHPEEILGVIKSISSPTSQTPQRVDHTRVVRATAVLKYLCKPEFLVQVYDLQAFGEELKHLSETRSWIPVLAAPPPASNYPVQLKWKGSGCNSHLMSLEAMPCCVLSTVDYEETPLLVGSQMYLSSPPLTPTLARALEVSTVSQHLVPHLMEVIDCTYRNNLAVESVSYLMHHIYKKMEEANVTDLDPLASSQEWLYIPKWKRFVNPSVVAIEENSSFRHNLEPYVYLLPETFLENKKLFLDFGMHTEISQEQILLVLEKIRNEVSSKQLSISLRDASNLVMSILNWFTDNGSRDVSDTVQQSNVYIPIDTETEDCDYPQLENAREVLYSDSDFLKEYASSESETKLMFSHSSIHQRLAESLGLRLLSDELDISEDAFADTGQQESLTERLKTILKDYKDGLTIVKELLQNADDAEATEFNICFDNRHHSVKKQRLFFQGMLQSHGPALVFHNNKTFSDEDFINITKLAGATKEKKQLKIGKFGIGFCSVYHISDVPSFISRDQLHILDPTLMCLAKEVKNPNKPGKKVRFTEKMISRSEQLNPYVGLFGFNKTKPYNGTLFRLPFRSEPSDLSSKCYDERIVNNLMTELQKCASKLLLFLQHVNCITFQKIERNQKVPTTLFKISKTRISLPIALPSSVELSSISLLKDSVQTSEYWLVANSKTTLKHCGSAKYATCSVACPLSNSTSTYELQVLDGELFCFLPLLQETGLPVHVSANFAVISNRRGIWTSDEVKDKADSEVVWNQNLMKCVVPNTYCHLLIAMQKMASNNLLVNYTFHILWPLKSMLKVNNPWEEILSPLYEMITKRELFLTTTKKWMELSSCKVLASAEILKLGDNSTDCVMDVLTYLKLPLIKLPMQYHEHFQLLNSLITEESFVKLFFKHLASFHSIKTTRNEVIQNILEIYATEYDDGSHRSYFLHNFLKNQACIPTTPDGAVLRKCEELIDPESEFASLYSKDDGHFPDTAIASRHLCQSAFENLGIIYNDIPWKLLVERAQSIPATYNANQKKALNRVKLILKCIESKNDPKSQHLRELHLAEFLPVSPKPADYPPSLTWKGEGIRLSRGSSLTRIGTSDKYHSDGHAMIAGSQTLFLCEDSPADGGCGYVNRSLCQLLQIKFYPSVFDVVCQLKELVRSSAKTNAELTTNIISQIYSFLNRELQYAHENKKKVPDVSEMRKNPCIWTGKEFITVQYVAKNWKMHDGPFLYAVPSSLISQPYLCSELHIKNDFTECDVTLALERMSHKFGKEPLDESHTAVFEEMMPLLHKIKPKQFSNFKILLPDERMVLRWSTELAYNDAEWAPNDGNRVYVNDIIPSKLAKQLHIKAISSEVLEKFTVKEKSYFAGAEFGQREDLTLRIQNILRDYPFDITVLKELLQNADDAKATKMFVILDKRYHRSKKVLSENWSKLQGPALLVWNSSTFSDADLKGIQKLGLGSKRSDHESIGQYGIGFNVVYHLTDCPSFVTGGDTLCILDPHCHFVPGATPKSPGRMFSGGEFWSTYPDIQSAYLRNELSSSFPELSGGSLFRFPLRHTEDLVSMSDIVQKEGGGSGIITAEEMHSKLIKWAPQMKNAMFFLNHVTELKFFVIEESSTTVVSNHFTTHVDSTNQKCRENLFKKASAFKGNESYLIHYPLSLTDLSYKKKVEEKWIIQQGVGDVHNVNQKWQFVNQVKPKHGIAMPLKSFSETEKSSAEKEPIELFRGRLFCFLPLPIETNLPVHINGNFILNSTRLNLWYKPEKDDKTRWNVQLIKAIGSSYEKFLVNVKQYFFTQERYESSLWPSLLDAIHRYYHIFPEVNPRVHLDKIWQSLLVDVYAKIVSSNDKILIVVKQAPASSSAKKMFILHWHSIKADHSSSKVYFWESREGCREHDQKTIRPILERIGMNITSAPLSVKGCLNTALKAADQYVNTIDSTSPQTNSPQMIDSTSPQTVYLYYTQHYHQCSPTNSFPCAIEDAPFISPTDFKEFTLYSLCEFVYPVQFAFSKPPFGYPLLLTEDRQLRCFDASNKILQSKFAETFPQSQNMFLHHKLLDVYYDPSYFAERSTGMVPILKVLEKYLPAVLFSCRKCDNNSHAIISIEKLKNLWKCLAEDSMFNSNLFEIIKKCAIIPSTSGYLFQSSDKFLQPVFVRPDNLQQWIKTVEVLKSIGMPFVDTTVIMGTEIQCPELTQSNKVLENLYYLFQETNFSNLMNENRAKVLVDLIKEVEFNYNSDNRKNVMSLPLFQTVDGKFVSIYSKSVYLWPPDKIMCDAAYSKWVLYADAIFLSKPSTTWLYYPPCFGIQSITAEELYIKFVFPHFSSFTDEERYNHLKHIRDKLYADSKHYMSRSIVFSLSAKYKSAKNFIAELNDLKCLKRDDGTLARAKDFCDHNQTIFKTFSKKFQFLPEAYKTCSDNDEWMTFFKDLGLRLTVTKDEYLDFCSEVSTGHHSNLSQASTILVQHLLSEAANQEYWYTDITFLSKVSNIPFVQVEKLESLDWIAKPAPPSVTFVLGNSANIEFSSPSQSAVSDCSTLLWTVKPIVDLHLPQYSTAESRALLNGLGVTENSTVKTADIIANISNISRSSGLAAFSLFDNYPDARKPPDGAKGLMEIMLEMFQHLMNKHIPGLQNDNLNSLACVPVHSMPQITSKWQLVLVKPCYVLTCEVEKFHPYLHKLPDDLMSVFTLLGIKTAINLTHIQATLQRAYEEAENEKLEANTQICVVESLKCLKGLLYDMKGKRAEVTQEEELSPLYLPGMDGKLHLSTRLMYGDTSEYRGHMMLNLQTTSYAQLHIRTNDYSFTATDLCNAIPEKIRPQKMSQLCEQSIVSSLDEVADSRVTTKIKETLKVNLLSKAALKIIAHHTKDDSIEEKLGPIIETFLSGIQVLTVRNLKMSIKLKETGSEIGNISTDFHLQCEENHNCLLYLDSKIDVPSDEKVIHQIADHILSQVTKQCPKTAPELTQEIRKNLIFLLKVQNDTQIEKMLHKEGIIIESDDLNFPTPEFGKEIPPSWHHRLDQDNNNIFYPTEWVGYEDHENHFIFVQICYPKLPDEFSDWDSVPRLEMKYVIHVRKDDLDGIEVSGLDLYKFIKGKLKSKTDPSQPSEDLSVALEIYEGNAESGKRSKYDAEELRAIKEKIRQELKDIMKLPDEQKKRAVKRLYLKWHPDKNPDNPEFAEEVFKFIQSELKRMEGGESDSPGSSWERRSWFYDFSSWDNTARDHSHFFNREHRSYSSRSSGFHQSSGSSFFYESQSADEAKNIKEGWRWMNQAEVDLGMLRINNAKAQEAPALKGYGLVCFLSHQVSEKALQGGVYAICGEYERTVTDHNLSRRAYMIQARRLGQTLGLLSHVSPLERYYLDTRYPNRCPSDIPAKYFDASDAENAVQHAEFVFDMIKNLMPEPV